MFYAILTAGDITYVSLNGNNKDYDPPSLMDVRKILGDNTSELAEGVFECNWPLASAQAMLEGQGYVKGDYPAGVLEYMKEAGAFIPFDEEEKC